MANDVENVTAPLLLLEFKCVAIVEPVPIICAFQLFVSRQKFAAAKRCGNPHFGRPPKLFTDLTALVDSILCTQICRFGYRLFDLFRLQHHQQQPKKKERWSESLWDGALSATAIERIDEAEKEGLWKKWQSSMAKKSARGRECCLLSNDDRLQRYPQISE